MSTAPVTPDPDPLDVIQEEARAVAQFFGVKQCEVAAEMLVGRIARRLGGRRVYLAADRRARAERDASVRSRFTGANYEELAAAEGISVRQVRNIVDRKPQSEKK